MDYQITLRGRSENPDNEYIITGEEYEEISKALNKAKLIKLRSGVIINAADIKKIDPMPETEKQQIIPKDRRLEEEYVPIEKRAMNNPFWLKSMIKGLKQFIDSKGGIENCQPQTKETLNKWEMKLNELTQNKTQEEINF